VAVAPRVGRWVDRAQQPAPVEEARMNRREHTEPEDRLRTSRGAALWAAAQAGRWIARAGDRWAPDLAPAQWAATRVDRLGQRAVAAEEWVRDLLRDRWAVAPAEPQGVRLEGVRYHSLAYQKEIIPKLRAAI